MSQEEATDSTPSTLEEHELGLWTLIMSDAQQLTDSTTTNTDIYMYTAVMIQVHQTITT